MLACDQLSNAKTSMVSPGSRAKPIGFQGRRSGAIPLETPAASPRSRDRSRATAGSAASAPSAARDATLCRPSGRPGAASGCPVAPARQRRHRGRRQAGVLLLTQFLISRFCIDASRGRSQRSHGSRLNAIIPSSSASLLAAELRVQRGSEGSVRFSRTWRHTGLPGASARSRHSLHTNRTFRALRSRVVALPGRTRHCMLLALINARQPDLELKCRRRVCANNTWCGPR